MSLIPQNKIMNFLHALVEEEFITEDSLEDKDILNTLITKFTNCLDKAGFNVPNTTSVNPSTLKLKMSRSPHASPVEVSKKKKAMNGYLLFNKIATSVYISNGIKAPIDHLANLWKVLPSDEQKLFNSAAADMDIDNPVLSTDKMEELSKHIVLRRQEFGENYSWFVRINTAMKSKGLPVLNKKWKDLSDTERHQYFVDNKHHLD